MNIINMRGYWEPRGERKHLQMSNIWQRSFGGMIENHTLKNRQKASIWYICYTPAWIKSGRRLLFPISKWFSDIIYIAGLLLTLTTVDFQNFVKLVQNEWGGKAVHHEWGEKGKVRWQKFSASKKHKIRWCSSGQNTWIMSAGQIWRV